MIIPRTFESWFDCIVNDYGINLTPNFAKERIEVLDDLQHSETKKFIALYGEQHYRLVLSWFKRIISQSKQ